MEKRYGFFGGSFNPVTNAHINLANLVVEKYNLDKVVFVPMGDRYQKQNLASEQYRYEMLKIATLGKERLEVSDIELNLPYALTTLQAFQKIKEQYNDVTPYFMIGADNLIKLTNSQDFEILAKNYEYIVLERGGQTKSKINSNPILKRFEKNFIVLEENPYEQVSSTTVRNNLKNAEKLENMIPKEVYEYIIKNRIYENKREP